MNDPQIALILDQVSTALADIVSHLEAAKKDGDPSAALAKALAPLTGLPAALAQAMKNLPAPKVEVSLPAQAERAQCGWRFDVDYGPNFTIKSITAHPITTGAKR